MTRNEFLRLLAGCVAASSCGDDGGGDSETSSDGSTGPSTSTGGTTGGPTSDSAESSSTGTGTGGTTGGGACDGTQIEISANHGHELMVPLADVEAGAEKTYPIQGASPHEHTVTLTPAEFAVLQQGMSVTVNSTLTNFHVHMVTVSCA